MQQFMVKRYISDFHQRYSMSMANTKTTNELKYFPQQLEPTAIVACNEKLKKRETSAAKGVKKERKKLQQAELHATNCCCVSSYKQKSKRYCFESFRLSYGSSINSVIGSATIVFSCVQF